MQANYELRIDLEDFDNGTAYAHYGAFGVGLFSVDPEEDGYPVTVSDYSGTAGQTARQVPWKGHKKLAQARSVRASPVADSARAPALSRDVCVPVHPGAK